MNNYLGKEFHRKSAMDANKDQKNASELLKSATTKGESLQEWFNKEKKKPAPKAEDAEKEPIMKLPDEKEVAKNLIEEIKSGKIPQGWKDKDPQKVIAELKRRFNL